MMEREIWTTGLKIPDLPIVFMGWERREGRDDETDGGAGAMASRRGGVPEAAASGGDDDGLGGGGTGDEIGQSESRMGMREESP